MLRKYQIRLIMVSTTKINCNFITGLLDCLKNNLNRDIHAEICCDSHTNTAVSWHMCPRAVFMIQGYTHWYSISATSVRESPEYLECAIYLVFYPKIMDADVGLPEEVLLTLCSCSSGYKKKQKA